MTALEHGILSDVNSQRTVYFAIIRSLAFKKYPVFYWKRPSVLYWSFDLD